MSVSNALKFMRRRARSTNLARRKAPWWRRFLRHFRFLWHSEPGTAGRRGIVHCQRGGPLAEFALALPFLTLMLLGIHQFGTTLYLQNNMINAARDAVRKLAAGEVDQAGAEAVAQAYLGDWNRTFTVSSFVPDTTDPDRAVTVRVTIPLAEASPLVDILGLSGTELLAAGVTMRLEE